MTDFQLFHLIDSPFYNSRINVVNVPNYQESGLFTIFVANLFYPALMPEFGKLVSLTVTSDDIIDKINESIGKENEIIFVNPHSTKINDNYVSYGQVKRIKLPEQLYHLYLDVINFQLAIDKPILLRKNEPSGQHFIPISSFRYFSVKSSTNYGPISFDCTYNAMLFKLTREDFKFSKKRARTDLSNKSIETVSMRANILYLNSNSSNFAMMNINCDFKIYKKLVEKGEGLYIGHFYTIYNLNKYGERKDSINILTKAIFFDYSYEALFPFLISKIQYSGISVRAEISKLFIEETRAKILRGFQESVIKIRTTKRWYKIIEEANLLKVVFVSPGVIFKFLKAYALFEGDRAMLLNVLSSENLIESISNFLNSISNSHFYEGNLVNVNLKTFLTEPDQ